MYHNSVLPATGMALAFWWPLAGFALIAAGVAIWRIAAHKKQPKTDGTH